MKQIRLHIDQSDIPHQIRHQFRQSIIEILKNERNRLIANCEYNSDDKLFMVIHPQVCNAFWYAGSVCSSDVIPKKDISVWGQVSHFYDNDKLLNKISKNVTDYIIKRLKHGNSRNKSR